MNVNCPVPRLWSSLWHSTSLHLQWHIYIYIYIFICNHPKNTSFNTISVSRDSKWIGRSYVIISDLGNMCQSLETPKHRLKHFMTEYPTPLPNWLGFKSLIQWINFLLWNFRQPPRNVGRSKRGKVSSQGHFTHTPNCSGWAAIFVRDALGWPHLQSPCTQVSLPMFSGLFPSIPYLPLDASISLSVKWAN